MRAKIIFARTTFKIARLKRAIAKTKNSGIPAVEGESLLMSLSGIALSSGSACTSASLEPSYVLRGKASPKGHKVNVCSYWKRCGLSSQFNSIWSRPIHNRRRSRLHRRHARTSCQQITRPFASLGHAAGRHRLEIHSVGSSSLACGVPAFISTETYSRNILLSSFLTHKLLSDPLLIHSNHLYSRLL